MKVRFVRANLGKSMFNVLTLWPPHELSKYPYLIMMQRRLYPYLDKTAKNRQDEKWRDIPGYEGYQVSNHGRVRSLDRYVPHMKLPPGFSLCQAGVGLPCCDSSRSGFWDWCIEKYQ